MVAFIHIWLTWLGIFYPDIAHLVLVYQDWTHLVTCLLGFGSHATFLSRFGSPGIVYPDLITCLLVYLTFFGSDCTIYSDLAKLILSYTLTLLTWYFLSRFSSPGTFLFYLAHLANCFFLDLAHRVRFPTYYFLSGF